MNYALSVLRAEGEGRKSRCAPDVLRVSLGFRCGVTYLPLDASRAGRHSLDLSFMLVITWRRVRVYR
jgi:hypothetical protein